MKRAKGVPAVGGERRWWRIQVDSAGKVVACSPVEHKERDGDLIFYVEACDQKEAGRRAWNAHCKVVQKRRRAALRAEGKCEWCARANDRPKGRCTTCQGKDREYSQRARDKAAGLEVPEADRSIAIAARADGERKELRLEVLQEVRAAWQRLDTFDAFARWLAVAIVDAGGLDRQKRKAS